MIEYRGVYKTFDVPVLSGVDLVVNEGETLSIVGPSGTGKSVLLKTTIAPHHPGPRRGLHRRAARLLPREGGSRRHPPQGPLCLPVCGPLRLDERLRQRGHGPAGGGREEPGPARRFCAESCASLEMVNLDPHLVLRKLPAELSGGMRKRVGLARAIVAEPRIILYDEPVTGLDPVNAATVNGLIMSIAQRTEVTSIVVTHDIDGALEMSDRVALLDRGKLRFVGHADGVPACPDLTVRAFADRRVAAEVAMGLVNDEPLPTSRRKRRRRMSDRSTFLPHRPSEASTSKSGWASSSSLGRRHRHRLAVRPHRPGRIPWPLRPGDQGPQRRRHPQRRPRPDARRPHRPRPRILHRREGRGRRASRSRASTRSPPTPRVSLDSAGLLGGLAANVIPGPSKTFAKQRRHPGLRSVARRTSTPR